MEALITVAALVVIFGDSNPLSIASAVAGLGIVSGLTAFLTVGSTRRRASSQADLSEVEVESLQQTVIKAVRENVDAELGRMREMVNEARSREAVAIQGQAEAQLKLAEAQRALAESLELASKERHSMRNEMTAMTARNKVLEIEVAELRSEVASLRAQLDAERHGRRRGDTPVDTD